jgi:phosphopantetheine adenylyltransferase
MALADVLKNTTFTAFSTSEKLAIIQVITDLYGTTTGKAMLDKVVSESETLKFTMVTNAAYAFAGQYDVYIDPVWITTIDIVRPDGTGYSMDLQQVVIHELVHAIDGLLDPSTPTSHTLFSFYRTPDDYAGDTVLNLNP